MAEQDLYAFSEDNSKRVFRAMRDVEQIKAQWMPPEEGVAPVGSELIVVEVTDNNPTNGRWPGRIHRTTNVEVGTDDPEWEEAEDDGERIITVQVIPLPGGTLVLGTYWGVILGATDPLDQNESPELVVCAVAGVGSSSIPLVHVVAGENHPLNGGTDLYDWFCVAVRVGLSGQLEEIEPRVHYGLGLFEEDETGWVYEGTSRFPRHVDPDDPEETPTHAIPLFRDVNAEVDEDGPIYIIEWPDWGNTETEFILNPDTSGWTASCTGTALTITPTLLSVDYRLYFDENINLRLSISPTPSPPPP